MRSFSHHRAEVGPKGKTTKDQALKSIRLDTNRGTEGIDLVWFVLIAPQALQRAELRALSAVVAIVGVTAMSIKQSKGAVVISQGNSKVL